MVAGNHVQDCAAGINKFRDDLLDLGELKSYPVKRSDLSDRQSLKSKRGRPFLIYRRMLPT